MKLFDPVCIVCDPTMLDIAHALRDALEFFRLRVHFYFCNQKRNVLDFLAGDIPPSQYVILCCGGVIPPDPPTLRFKSLVDLIDGRWQEVALDLTPASVPELVKLTDRTVLAYGCCTGDEALAQAFLDSGCRACIAPAGPLDQDAALLFPVSFFYHLLRAEREPGLSYTDEEAAKLAAAADTTSVEGTHQFRYFSRVG